MTPRILGLNIGYSYVDDYGALRKFHNALRPAYLLMMVDKDEQIAKAKAETAQMPGAQWIYRVHHKDDGRWWFPADDGRPQIATPLDYINQYGHLGRDGGILSVLNEPSSILTDTQLDGLVKWTEEFMGLALLRGVKCCLLNWADRNPRLVDGKWEERYRPLVKLAARFPELFTIGMHLYGPDSITEHLDGYIAACKVWGIDRPPQVIATEFGLDSTGGKEQGYRQHGWDGARLAGWTVNLIQGSLKPYFESGLLAGLIQFAWNRNWRDQGFDVQQDEGWQKDIVAAAERGALDIVVKPVTKPLDQFIPKPPVATYAHEYMVLTERSIRSGPGINYRDEGTLHPTDTVTIYDFPATQELRADGQLYQWKWVESVKGNGWVQMTNWKPKRLTPPTVEVPVVTPPPLVSPPLIPKPPEIILTLTPAQLEALIDRRIALMFERVYAAGLAAVKNEVLGVVL